MPDRILNRGSELALLIGPEPCRFAPELLAPFRQAVALELFGAWHLEPDTFAVWQCLAPPTGG
jgi:hypothetical protein